MRADPGATGVRTHREVVGKPLHVDAFVLLQKHADDQPVDLCRDLLSPGVRVGHPHPGSPVIAAPTSAGFHLPFSWGWGTVPEFGAQFTSFTEGVHPSPFTGGRRALHRPCWMLRRASWKGPGRGEGWCGPATHPSWPLDSAQDSPCPCGAPATRAARPTPPPRPPHWGSLGTQRGPRESGLRPAPGPAPPRPRACAHSLPSPAPPSSRLRPSPPPAICRAPLTKHASGDAGECLGRRREVRGNWGQCHFNRRL